MPPQLRLDDALDQVVAAAAGILDGHRQPGGDLADVTAVVTGDRARARPDPPYLWVVVAGWDEDHSHALHVTVTAHLMVAAVVASEDPEDGWLSSLRFAARGRALLLAERTLGLPFVADTLGRRGEPIGQLRAGRRFGYFARLDVTFTILEP